ncbi:hypothetical protein AVEN_149096-1 [Araneus ventricosus]|uniref:Integrase catalytic domain-containing protein n=1 Tax=Araneus ventricosus TaxID=182803 RepID=A0A4Y2UQ45_ARAVE|nr:hypothetical protein AVEN_149096-1 [Araneus ventricosus]
MVEWSSGPGPPLMNESEYSCQLKNGIIPEMPISSVCASTNSDLSFLSDLLCTSNSYVKILRIFSYVLRFVNVKKSNVIVSGPLYASELNQAENRLVRMVQGEVFSSEIRDLQCQKGVLPNSKLKNLNPFLDSYGILRVGGRLGNSDLPYVSKYPAILPNKHKLTNQIIVYFHLKNLHIGASSLLHCVRERFWPLNGRSLCRKIVHECIACFKAKPVVTSQLMGNLARDRVVPDYPFNCSGVDFCGPFMIRYRNQRKGVLHKMYICIFVCFVSKAVHIEIVSDLTSEAFIATLKRFFGRRAEGIEWKFILPRAPSFGGLWEAAVKSAKYHLKRIVGRSNLTYEEFLTVSIQIERILNSRPLCPLSSSADDLNALTPAHFLIGRSMNSIIENNFTDLNESVLKRWQRVTRLVQLIWKKWHRGYLSELQQRNKWQFQKKNVKVGDLVVLIEDNMPTFKWPLGRVTKIYSGNATLIRVVKVKTQNGEYKRAISRVCLLPMPV